MLPNVFGCQGHKPQGGQGLPGLFPKQRAPPASQGQEQVEHVVSGRDDLAVPLPSRVRGSGGQLLPREGGGSRTLPCGSRAGPEVALLDASFLTHMRARPSSERTRCRDCEPVHSGEARMLLCSAARQGRRISRIPALHGQKQPLSSGWVVTLWCHS